MEGWSGLYGMVVRGWMGEDWKTGGEIVDERRREGGWRWKGGEPGEGGGTKERMGEGAKGVED